MRGGCHWCVLGFSLLHSNLSYYDNSVEIYTSHTDEMERWLNKARLTEIMKAFPQSCLMKYPAALASPKHLFFGLIFKKNFHQNFARNPTDLSMSFSKLGLQKYDFVLDL